MRFATLMALACALAGAQFLASQAFADDEATYPEGQFAVPLRLREPISLPPAPQEAAPAVGRQAAQGAGPGQPQGGAARLPVQVQPSTQAPRQQPALAARIQAPGVTQANLTPPGQPPLLGPVSPPVVPPVIGGTACVALTFDDGPDVNLTPRLLAILAAEQVKATFFVVGQRVASWPDIVRAEAAAGHEIGNHTWDHPVLPQLSDEAIRRELANTDAAVQRAAGVTPRVIRPPYGSISARVRATDGRPWVLWYTDTLDWRTHSAANTERVAASTPSGSIVLMHDIQASTINAADALIKDLKARGFQFVTVSEMLAGACGAYRDRQVSL